MQILGLNFLNIQITQTTQQQQNPIKKWAEDLNRHSLKEDKYGQEAHEKMLSVANY